MTSVQVMMMMMMMMTYPAVAMVTHVPQRYQVSYPAVAMVTHVPQWYQVSYPAVAMVTHVPQRYQVTYPAVAMVTHVPQRYQCRVDVSCLRVWNLILTSHDSRHSPSKHTSTSLSSPPQQPCTMTSRYYHYQLTTTHNCTI